MANLKDRLGPECNLKTLNQVLDLLGDRWTILVLVSLALGRKRFSELQREVDQLSENPEGKISSRMLARTLKRVEEYGIVSREILPTRPPRVEYAMTESGRALIEPLKGLTKWATTHHPPKLLQDSASSVSTIVVESAPEL